MNKKPGARLNGGIFRLKKNSIRFPAKRWVWGLLCALISFAGLFAIVGATNQLPVIITGDVLYSFPESPSNESEEMITVYVCSGDQFFEVDLFEGTVADALAASDAVYGSEDLVTPATHMLLEDGMRISITDVTVSQVTETQALPFGTVEKKDNTVLIGRKKVKSEGKNGEQALIYSVTYHDGVEFSRTLVDTQVLTEPVDKVVSVGTLDDSFIQVSTQKVFKNDNRGDKDLPLMSQVKDVVYYQATAYTHTGNKTSTGTWPSVGTIAVNPNQIPYGTKLYVEGYGFGIAADTGGFRHSGRKQIDLFMDTERECYSWGRKNNVRVFILK